MTVRVEPAGAVLVVTIDRPARRNAVDRTTASALADAFRSFEADDDQKVAILTGAAGTFCAGADLHALAAGTGNTTTPEGDGPMGPTRMELSKPVIAAIAGHAVAGGLELALWCDLRVLEEDAILGVYCRRFGVPLVDGGTVRLPRLVGQSRAADLILTGRSVRAPEALAMGLVNRVVAPGQALNAARELAREIAAFPQACLRADLQSMRQAFEGSEAQAIGREFRRAVPILEGAELREGAAAFARGAGRHGTPRED